MRKPIVMFVVLNAFALMADETDNLPEGVSTNRVVYVDAFSNPSFEDGGASWTWVAGNVQDNAQPFVSGDSAYWTTNGTHYAAVKANGSMSSTFEVPRNGRYAISFEIGCRYESRYKVYKIPVTVMVDEGTDHEWTYDVPTRSSNHGFMRVYTDLVMLSGGTHKLTVKTGSHDVTNARVLFDAIALTSVPQVDIKVSSGELVVEDVAVNGRVLVKGGRLTLLGGSLTGAIAGVKESGALSCAGVSFVDSDVSVNRGGVLLVADDARNLVTGGDFEDFDTGDAGYKTGNPPGWAFTPNGGSGACGVQKNGNATVSKDWYETPSGQQTAFLRSQYYMTTSVTIPTDGVYALSFLQTARNKGDSYEIPLSVMVGGTEVFALAPRSGYADYQRERTLVNLSAGTYELCFATGGESWNGPMLFIDDIRLMRESSKGCSFSGTVIAFESGACLRLENAERLKLDEGSVRVDSRAVVGSGSTLSAAGVIVEGAGSVRIGEPGVVIILR